ncbi:hypothetical protein A3D62_03195 [Candidatus Kaiserbacteria bacterium RIFCSPHIGHO2_02_FULL_49_11]|uniref:Uncharacterized protein n=1 Tax=Candidatus Kaiserbacteria bacterium RIFCSPHIGHO2_02_FULL_49_11 TaxID=1798489 RepID=A0A1F6D1V5_9BACT|nr:MAG: hypothetical protein A3D62_03195 [Candidatus Kaiserbacteria bacterium RIFCSPHIGHO2_02_FULL_49_11]
MGIPQSAITPADDFEFWLPTHKETYPVREATPNDTDLDVCVATKDKLFQVGVLNNGISISNFSFEESSSKRLLSAGRFHNEHTAFVAKNLLEPIS